VGCESGVLFYEQICHELKLPYSNDFSKSEAHRNKFLQQEILAANNVPVVKQLNNNEFAAIQSFISNELMEEWPVVLKPVDSSGTVGVHVCYDWEQAKKAHYEVLNLKNVFG